ncbi:MAG: 30S ribosomal protein S12 methylthiotransferase RimO [Candidatus Omnitrophota bacterium]
MKGVTVGLLSLGCARNLVDSEVILGYLKTAGFTILESVEKVDVAVVNTCGFIREAEEESVDIILKLGQLKKQGEVKKIIVYGCLAQRYKSRLKEAFPDIDAFIGTGNPDKVVTVIKQLWLPAAQVVCSFSRPRFLYSHLNSRLKLTPGHFTYIKICEGCNNCCSYCIIPRLKGRFRSRTMASILKETKTLLDKEKISEINLIGQDTTNYGRDIYGQTKLTELLRRICGQLKNRPVWLRLLYTHPAHVSPQLIEAVKEESAICKYIDLPIQHINDTILKRMNRKVSRGQIISLITALRREIPGLAIRTTLLVGFPGETDKQFGELLDFVEDTKFERLGIFKYSREERTQAFGFSGQIPEKVKQARYQAALSLQQEISRRINQRFLGKTLVVLIDEQDQKEKNIFLGRTEFDAPEVDGCVYVRINPGSKHCLSPGQFARVKITDTLEYDLVAEV